MRDNKTTTVRTTAIETIRQLTSEAAQSTLVRFTVLAVALGAVPFYLLSMAVAALGGN